MDKQPEALRLAECLTDYTECTLAEMDQAASELRRLYALNQELVKALEQFANCKLNEDNCASLEVATRRIRYVARAAIAKAKEQT